jgi:hypothetical protein
LGQTGQGADTRSERNKTGRLDDLPGAVRELTDGRGPISVIDAVGMEAHGAPIGKLAHTFAGLLPDPLAQKLIEKAGTDR